MLKGECRPLSISLSVIYGVAVSKQYPGFLYLWAYLIETGGFYVFNSCLCYVELFFSKLSYLDVKFVINNFPDTLSGTLEEFPSRFLKCSFDIFIRSSWQAAFNLALSVVFFISLPLMSANTIRDYLSSSSWCNGYRRRK